MRLIAVIRLSRETEESTSPERQREQIAKYADLYQHQVVGEAVDLDVSGDISPWDRERLGPWLTDDPQQPWDALCSAKLDRLTRKITDFGELLAWCQARNKTVVSVAEHLDFGTAAGRMYGNVLVSFAQFERERMAERRREAAKTMREAGRFGGGQVPWGYRVDQTATGRVLAPDEDVREVIHAVVDQMLNGGTYSGIARWLEANDVPTPRGQRKKDGRVYRWSAATVREVLRSRSLLGEMTHKGAVVRGPDGMPVRYMPVLDDETWTRLQHALDRASKPTKGGHRRAAYLLQIAFCGHQKSDGSICGMPLHQTTAGNGRKYYRCQSRQTGTPCGAKLLPMDLLDDWIDGTATGTFGLIPVTRTEIIRGDDRGRERADVGQQIRDLTEERYVRGVTRPDWNEMMAKLQARYDDLEDAGTQDKVVQVPTGETVGELFARMDREGKRRFMLDQGWKFWFYRDEFGRIQYRLTEQPPTGPTANWPTEAEAAELIAQYPEAEEKIRAIAEGLGIEELRKLNEGARPGHRL